MKNFFGNHGVLILFIAVVIAVAMAVSTALTGGRANIASNTAGVIFRPAEQALSGFAQWVGSVYSYTYEYDALKAENEELKKKIADMESDVRDSQANKEENERLRKLLNLREQRRNFEFESATVVSRNSSNWASVLTLSKGSAQGVKVSDCVVTETGDLVGVVAEVGLNWCDVITTVDTDLEMGALIFRSNEAAIAEGDFNLMSQGKLKLSYLPEKSQILNGDLIVTSGKGGVYPSGLVIGTVDEVKTDESGLASYAVVSPAVDFASLTEVFVIKSFNIVE